MDKCPHCQGDLEWPKPRCLWCDREAVAFCDAAFGQTMVEADGRRVWAMASPFFTCDAPLCAEHRKVVGFLCGEDPDTFDRCPVHANSEERMADITEADATAMRRAVQVAARRSRFAAV
jgi:hypothetical protein